MPYYVCWQLVRRQNWSWEVSQDITGLNETIVRVSKDIGLPEDEILMFWWTLIFPDQLKVEFGNDVVGQLFNLYAK